jgi:hypothetical protein
VVNALPCIKPPSVKRFVGFRISAKLWFRLPGTSRQ